jgi:hypothetical protein
VRRTLLLTAAVGLLVLGLGACASPSSSSTAPTSTTFAGPPPALPQGVVDTVLDVAVRAGGDADHATAQYAYGTRRQILRALGMGDLPPHQVDSEVFVVVVNGRFALPDAKVRKGAPEPAGDHLVVVVDPDEPANPLDVGVTATNPPLARVGQVRETVLAPATPAPPS